MTGRLRLTKKRNWTLWKTVKQITNKSKKDRKRLVFPDY